MNRRTRWAVLVGMLATIGVTPLIDTVLHLRGIFPPRRQPLDDRLALLAPSDRIPIPVGAAWLTAYLAPDQPVKHAPLLGYPGAFLALVGLVASWGRGLARRGIPSPLQSSRFPDAALAASSSTSGTPAGHDSRL